jgi:hypothetical protein
MIEKMRVKMTCSARMLPDVNERPRQLDQKRARTLVMISPFQSACRDARFVPKERWARPLSKHIDIAVSEVHTRSPHYSYATHCSCSRSKEPSCRSVELTPTCCLESRWVPGCPRTCKVAKLPLNALRRTTSMTYSLPQCGENLQKWPANHSLPRPPSARDARQAPHPLPPGPTWHFRDTEEPLPSA